MGVPLFLLWLACTREAPVVASLPDDAEGQIAEVWEALPVAPSVFAVPAPPPPPRRADPGALSVTAAARYYLAHTPPSGFTPDCSGFVAAAYSLAGFPIAGSPPWMWERASAAAEVHLRRLPSPGDIAFFDDTYDPNRNGLRDDPKSHVAVVLSVDPATGDILLAHGGSTQGRGLLRMNLLHPADPSRNGGLRRPNRRDPPDVARLAGELWVGFATVHAADLPIWLGLQGLTLDPS